MWNTITSTVGYTYKPRTCAQLSEEPPRAPDTAGGVSPMGKGLPKEKRKVLDYLATTKGTGVKPLGTAWYWPGKTKFDHAMVMVLIILTMVQAVAAKGGSSTARYTPTMPGWEPLNDVEARHYSAKVDAWTPQ